MFIATRPRACHHRPECRGRNVHQSVEFGELKGGLEQGVQHVEAGFIGGKPGTFDLHAAEAADVDAAVRAAAPRASPLFKLGHFRRAVVNEVVDDILLAKPVAPGNGVVKMVLKAIMILRNGGGTPSAATVWLRMG
jgi:hypothetical protein